MAISDNQQQPQQRPQPQPQPNVGQQQAPFVRSGDFGHSFHTGQLFGAPISRSLGSEFYVKLKNGLADAYKITNDPALEITILDMDRANESALLFSSIIVAMRNKRLPDSGVAYHVLILEATGDLLPPYIETMNNQAVEILRVTADAVDDVFLRIADERIRKAFPQGPYQMVEAEVVPLDFNPDDTVSVHQLALNIGLAIGTELETTNPNFRDLNLIDIKNDSSLVVNLAFNRSQIAGVDGHPMRSDVLVNFNSSRQRQQRGGPVNTGDREVKISELSGFIDLVWDPIVQQGGMFSAYTQPQVANATQKYAARMVLTNLASDYGYTPGSILLALSTALSARDDNNWIQAFKPVATTGKEIDITDIGAVNIEANLTNEPNGFGTRIDTKADNFRLSDLGQLVAALVRPGLMISLDCPKYGPQYWYLSLFSMAASGSTNAYNLLFDTAQQLTNGHFGKNFKHGTPIFTDLDNYIHNGTWIDNKGQKRDIRDIDHVAVCNLVGERNPQFIREWSDTFLQVQYPLQMRLAARKKMISGLTQDTAVFTGFSHRVTFTGEFLNALIGGIRDTGFQVRVNTPLTGSDISNQRAVAGFAQSALIAPGQSYMSVGGFNYSQQPNQWPIGGQFGTKY